MKWTVTFLAILSIALVWASPARFDDFQIHKVAIETKDHLETLQSIATSDGLIFLDEPSRVGQHVQIVVGPNERDNFQEIIIRNAFTSVLLAGDLQKLMDQESAVKSRAASDDDEYNLEEYHRLNEMYAWLDSLAVTYPNVVTRIKGGDTFEGRSIEGVKLSRNPNNPAIFIEANIHAREWIASASTNWIINALLTSTDREIQTLLNNYNWYIFPVANPDGYEYSHTTYRLWRKTRSRSTSLICYGADPNRNFDMNWQVGGEGASADPCSETFGGAAPFSEIETRTLSNFALGVRNEVKAYLAFHSAANMILSPWGYTSEVPEDHEIQMQIMTAAYNRLHAVHGTEYTYGNSHDTICK